MPGVVRVRMGTIDEPVAAPPVAHFHVAAKCNWETNDMLPQYRESYVPNEAGRS
jgi:hypothetical protein